MSNEDDAARSAFGNLLGNLAPGMTNKVLKNAPQYLVEDYRQCVAALQERSREVSTDGFTNEDDWSEAVADYLMTSQEMMDYRDVVSSLMSILKVVIALEIVIEGEVRHDH